MVKKTSKSYNDDADQSTDTDDKIEDVNTELSYLTLPDPEIEKVDESYVPEGFETVEDYLSDLRETYELDVQYDDDNRKAAVEDKKFAAGEQWDPQVLAQRAGLPCLTINTIPQFLAQLVGDWRQNKTAVKVLPAEGGDKNVADVRSDLIRAIETNSRADQVYTSAFESMVTCGDGAFRIGVQYASDDTWDQDIVIQPIDDALSVVWDRLSIDPTGRDAKHCFVDDVIPKKEFLKNWPESKIAELGSDIRQSVSSHGWLDDKTVRVTEHWRLIERKKLLVMFTDGTIYPFEEGDEENYMGYVQKHGKPVKSRLAPCKYAQMHLVTGFDILAGPYEWCLERLPIIRMSGRVFSLGDRRVRTGLVRDMKDAARLRNFWRSVAAEQLGYAPKAQWIGPESAFEGREDAWRRAHKTRDPLLIYNDDASAPPERVDPPVMQSALLNEAQINTQDMKDITGIHDASLGIQSNETSGKAIMARQREGDVAALTFYDNGNYSILEAGDVVNQLLGQIYDGTRIVRIIGEDESAKLVTINDDNNPNSPNLAVGKYDVALSTGASYTTRRVEAAESMMEAIQVFPEMMQYAGDLVVKAQDWPGAEEIADRLQKTVPPQLLSDKEKAEMGQQGPDVNAMMQQQAQIQEQAQQMGQQLQQLQQENLLLKTKHDTEALKLQIQQYEAETQRLLAYAQIIAQGDEAKLSQFESEADVALQHIGQMHQQNIDTAKVVQNHVIANQQMQQDAADAEANRQAQAAQAAQQANSTPAGSTPPSE
jgi:hypothetical protein